MNDDFFKDNLYLQLGLTPACSEQEILNALQSWYTRIEKGYVQGADTVDKVQLLMNLVNDKEYRLKSLILFGGFGDKAYDNYLEKLKKIFLAVKVSSKDWLELLQGLSEHMKKETWLSLLFSKCPLVQKGNSGDLAIIIKIQDSIFLHILSFHLQSLEDNFKRNDHINGFEHLKVLEGFPDLHPEKRRELAVRMSGSIHEYLNNQIMKITGVMKETEVAKSKFQAKAALSKIDRDLKEKILNPYDFLSAGPYLDNTGIKSSLQDLLTSLVVLYEKYGMNEKNLILNERIKGKTDSKSIQPPQKKSESKKISDKFEDLKGFTPDAQGIEEVKALQESLKSVKALIVKGEIKEAKCQVRAIRKKIKTVDGIQLMERLSADPFFFINIKAPIPRESTCFRFIHHKEIVNEQGSHVAIFWLYLLLPLFPLKAFVFNSENAVLGSIDFPRKYRKQQMMILGILFVVFFILRSFFGMPSSESTRPDFLIKSQLKQMDSTVVSPKEKLNKLIQMFNQQAGRLPDSLASEILSRFCSVFDELLSFYKMNNRLDFFALEIGAKLTETPPGLRKRVLQVVSPKVLQIFKQADFKPVNLFKWYTLAANKQTCNFLCEEYVAYTLNKGDSSLIAKGVKYSKQVKAKFTGKTIQALIKMKMIHEEDVIFLSQSMDQLSYETLENIILKIWDLSTTYQDSYALDVVNLIGKDYPELRLDLLKIILDKNKNSIYPWKNELLNFKFSAIDKRVKLVLSHQLIKNGRIDEMLKLAESIPDVPENDKLYFLRIPVLFYQNEFSQIIQFLESKNQLTPLDDFYKTILGISYFKTQNFEKSVIMLESIINKHFKPYCSIWSELNKRKTILNNYLNEQISSKKGKYEAIGRKIYLIQKDDEAARVKKDYIDGEIRKDFNIISLQQKLSEKQYIYDAFFAFIECKIKTKNPEELRIARDYLLSFKDYCADYNTEIYLGLIFHHLGKSNAFKEYFDVIEDQCLKEKVFLPLLHLLQIYKDLEAKDSMMRLAKLMVKKCEDEVIISKVIHKMLDLSDLIDDKIFWLERLKNHGPEDEIRLVLYKIEREQAKGGDRYLSALKQMDKISEKNFGIHNLDLLSQLGFQFYRHYLAEGNRHSLAKSKICFERAVKLNPKSVNLINSYLSVLWMNALESVFLNSPNLYLLNEDYLFPITEYIEDHSTGKETGKLFDQLNSSQEFILFNKLFNSMLENHAEIVIPPGLFLMIRSSQCHFLFYNKVQSNEALKSIPYNDFWGIPSFRSSLNKLSFYSKRVDETKKVFDRTSEEDLKHYPDSFLNYAEAQLRLWKNNKDNLRMTFMKLLEKAEYCNQLEPSVKAKRIILDLRICRLANWYDPNKETIPNESPGWVIRKAILDGQQLKSDEYEGLLNDLQAFYKTFSPFVHEDLLLIGSLTRKFDYKKNKNMIRAIELELLFCSDSARREILKKLL